MLFRSVRKSFSAACLLSALIAGAISTLPSPVTADKATVITISVNRAIKGDRQPLAPPIAQPSQHAITPVTSIGEWCLWPRRAFFCGSFCPRRSFDWRQCLCTAIRPSCSNFVPQLILMDALQYRISAECGDVYRLWKMYGGSRIAVHSNIYRSVTWTNACGIRFEGVVGGK